MKKLSVLVALIMAITVFWIPGQSVFADNEEGAGEPTVQAMEAVQISFDANGGSGTMDPQNVETGTSVKLDENSFTWDNHNFLGWATSKEGDVVYTDGATITVSKEMKLFAVWEEVKPALPTFNFDPNNNKIGQTYVTFNWDWTNGTGTVDIRLYKAPIKDRTSYYSYDWTDRTITNAYTFSGLSDGTEYRYFITATPSVGSPKTYEGTITTTAKKNNGWYTEGTNKYYYIKGVKQRETEVKLSADSSQLYHYFDCNGVFKGRRDYMYSRIKGLSSKTYLICVDRTNNVVCVYKGGKNKWYPYKYWSCVTGRMKKGDYHPTPLGTYKVKSRKMTFSGYGIPEKKKNRYSVWYCTRFKGSIFFHSQLYKYKSKSSFIPGGAAMGRNASHGCIRLHKANAAWVYKNCKKGTTVVVIQ